MEADSQPWSITTRFFVVGTRLSRTASPPSRCRSGKNTQKLCVGDGDCDSRRATDGTKGNDVTCRMRAPVRFGPRRSGQLFKWIYQRGLDANVAFFPHFHNVPLPSPNPHVCLRRYQSPFHVCRVVGDSVVRASERSDSDYLPRLGLEHVP